MRRRNTDSFWQSYSDLAMGLVGVFALILVLLLIRESQEAEQLEAEREDFAADLVALLESGHEIVERQDAVQEWIATVFEQGDCRLLLDERGQLARKGARGEPAQLYDSGSVELSAEAEAALRSCSENFFRLATCLSPIPEAQAACENLEGDSAFADSPEVRHVFREGIEAVVLQGNTDQVRYGDAPRVRYLGATHRLEDPLAVSYVDNAYLGAERARQALAHLLDLIEEHGVAEEDPVQVLMSRLRIESPSFGRYQAGPHSYLDPQAEEERPWREGACEGGDCAEARNLSLLLRWRKSSLRRPFEEFRAGLCRLLADPESSFAKGLEDAGEDREVYRLRFCGPTTDSSGETAAS